MLGDFTCRLESQNKLLNQASLRKKQNKEKYLDGVFHGTKQARWYLNEYLPLFLRPIHILMLWSFASLNADQLHN